jgi:hypothetical protein
LRNDCESQEWGERELKGGGKERKKRKEDAESVKKSERKVNETVESGGGC